MLWSWFSLVLIMCSIGVDAMDMGNNQQGFGPGACNLFCRQGTKCALVEPANCNGCQPQAQCVQQECDTTCRLPCPFFNRCVLTTSTSACCPVAACRSQFPGYTTTPQYTTTQPPYTTATPQYTTQPPYTTATPQYTTRPPYLTTTRYNWPFPFPFPFPL
ncbi:hypothetical protein GCK32_002627 [Trichostrongylus colubriformis]|uniref:Uncharacterized protein n=1 Tax=Trichostrongylus colubriformis TaxID=6319 RepID=A0AAN8G2R1_TRICO